MAFSLKMGSTAFDKEVSMKRPQSEVPRFERLALECVGGVAGDMLLGAFLAAGADKGAIHEAFANLNESALKLLVEDVEIHREQALWVRSIPPGNQLNSSHAASVSMRQVFEVLEKLQMPPSALRYAKKIFTILGNAESEAHQVHFDSVHLHEVGELDSILDVAGVAIAYESIGSPSLTCTELPSGSGTVNTSHGILDCPVPAVVAIANRFKIPMVDIEVKGETITPTGIAILAGLDCAFTGRSEGFQGRVVGRGAGTKRFSSRPNLIRLREHSQ